MRAQPIPNSESVKQVQGGGLRDSFLVDGVAFKKTFSYAGFEMQPKSYTDPKVLLLNIELELKSEKENAEVGRQLLSRSKLTSAYAYILRSSHAYLLRATNLMPYWWNFSDLQSSGICWWISADISING